MATQSPPTPTDSNPQVQEAVQPSLENQDVVKSEISPPSVFVNREPIREDQVQNAEKFLSHQKVRGSAVMYRRSFLERKGLTKEEIDEAFTRVPDPSPTISSSSPGGTNQDAQPKSLSNVQPQAPSQALQPAAVAPAGTIGRLTAARFHWTHALLAVGFIAVSGAGTFVVFKNAVIPRLKSWIRKVVLEEDDEDDKKISLKHIVAEEAAAAAKAAASAATDVARVSQEMLVSKNEERKYFEGLMHMLNVQVKEMKSMSESIRRLEGERYSHDTIPYFEQNHRGFINNSKQLYANGKLDVDSLPVRVSSLPAPVAPSPAPHPQSYMDIMSMVQRGERPPNIRDIDDKPPNPYQPLPNASLAPRLKPWETGQVANNSSGFWSQDNNSGVKYNIQVNGPSYNQRKNARITEIESEEEERKFVTSAASSQAKERPVQRLWVPPQPPPVLMPEAAAAIRQPKRIPPPPPPSQKQMTDDDKPADSSIDLTEELQKVTKISELGGGVEQNSELDGMLPESGNMTNGVEVPVHIESEIQEVEDY